MQVKRKNPLSGVFDPYSEDEGGGTLWPEDDALPPAVEPSGYRPAPAGFNDAPTSDIAELDAPTSEFTELDASTSDLTELDASTSDFTEFDAPASALPTPRQLAKWTVDEPDADSPLPVVTAASEPTQRGLGIPPPPSAKEAAWFAQLPSLASAAPPSPEAFTDRAAPEARAPEAVREPSENERITVRAPPGRSVGTFTGRRRAVAVLLLAGGTLLAALAVRHTTMRGSDSGSAMPAPAHGTTMKVAAALAVEKDRSVPLGRAAPREAPPHEDEPASQAPSDGTSETAESDVKSESRRHRSAKESRREKARRKARDAAKARATVALHVPAGSSHGDLPPVEAKAPEHREVLSLPPR